MKKLRNLSIFLLAIFLCGCNFYVKDRFIQVDEMSEFDLTKGEILDFNKNNLFVLKINEELSNKIKLKSDSVAYAENPFYVFKQEEDSPTEAQTSEETYLYLHDLNPKDGSRGRAIYWITYPLLSDTLQNAYFNNDSLIYTGTIKRMMVGNWYIKDKELAVYFLHEDKSVKKDRRVVGFKGHVNTKGGGKIFLMKQASSLAFSKGTKNTGFKSIEEDLIYIDIKDVFNLNGKQGLYYKQVDVDRDIKILPFSGKNIPDDDDFKGSSQSIEKVYCGECLKTKKSGEVKKYNCVFFVVDKKDENLYRFKKNRWSSAKKDEKYFTILNIDY